MILNNSGIVHCATRTRGREETAMNMQELLTYVEELTFKTSMFGYDKDEVDIQLDKICDEAEAIILAKEKEIEELKKESKTALGIAAAATGKTMEELEKDTQEDIVETEEDEQTVTLDEAEETVQETVSNEVPISTVAVADADEAQDEIETVRAQLVAAQKKVAALEAEIAAEKEKTEKAIARAEEAEKSAENNKAPETTDQAYERYMKNADLLCKQLSDLEGRQNAILDEAREQAEREREKARQDAADIIGEARKTAERLLKDAQENKENAIEEAKKIHEDSLRKVEEEKKQCDELSAQKAAMVNSLKKLTEDTARLMEKMQG
jgi:cell division septum initiation protein DivIVA